MSKKRIYFSVFLIFSFLSSRKMFTNFWDTPYNFKKSFWGFQQAVNYEFQMSDNFSRAILKWETLFCFEFLKMYYFKKKNNFKKKK